jgi:hypothetical protein
MAGAALFSTLLLSGVLANIGQGALIAGLIFTALVIRRVVVPRVPVLPGLITRVPLIVRLGACAYVAKWLTDHLVAPAIAVGTDSFTPLLQTLIISFAVAALLLPTSSANVK